MGDTDARSDLIASLLRDWQQHGRHPDFELLWRTVATTVRSTARTALAAAHIRDPDAVEDALSLVMDHLRRLPRGGVTAFDAERCGDGTAAQRYVRWLAKNRAADVARRRRRWPPLINAGEIDSLMAKAAEEDALECQETTTTLQQAIATLDPRHQHVITLLLAGESQAQIARAIGVCEGTVTRLRQRAIIRLRAALLAAETAPPVAANETPPRP
jgi:RNA polymerase sigma factor (sigma-70 family)